MDGWTVVTVFWGVVAFFACGYTWLFKKYGRIKDKKADTNTCHCNCGKYQ